MMSLKSLYSVIENNETLSSNDVSQIVRLFSNNCSNHTKNTLKRILSSRELISQIPPWLVLKRVCISDKGVWIFCPAQHRATEVKVVRDCLRMAEKKDMYK